MKRVLNKPQLAVVLVLLAVLTVSLIPSAAAAQTYHPNYQPQTRQELISYLYALIAQLEAQQQQPYQYHQNPVNRPVGAVLGTQYRSGFTNLEVETSGVNNVHDDEAWAFGVVDLNNVAYADVWFEYGRSRNLNERSSVGRIDYRSSETFRADLEDLDEDERYYLRAVAQDPNGHRVYGEIKSFFSDGYDRGRRSSRNDDEPDVDTESARDIDEDSAELRGEVDMNDFNNGFVFFVYGEDEDDVEDVEDEDEYRDIDERGDDLQKISVDRDLDRDDGYEQIVTGLDDDTEYYFRICVEYEDEDDDETLECGDVEDFETDRD